MIYFKSNPFRGSFQNYKNVVVPNGLGTVKFSTFFQQGYEQDYQHGC